MQVGIVLAGGNWPAVLEAAQRADVSAIDALGFWDHFHTERQDYAPTVGWAVYGALAALTKRLRLVPMVLDRPNYSLGVLAKESSMLGVISGGRFELGIGAGDYPAEEAAWGLPPYADAPTRVAELAEAVAALRQVWTGEQVDFAGTYVHLRRAGCRPAPPAPIRVVVGAGTSRRLIRSAAQYADEINVYGDDNAIQVAKDAIASTGRPVALSVLIDEWRDWGSAAAELERWRASAIDRLFVTLYQPYGLLPQICDLLG